MDSESRAVFFDALDREFNFEFAPAFRAGSPEQGEAAEEAIVFFQYQLSRYLDSVIRPDDVRYKSTVLTMGSGTALAALGPSIEPDVMKMATNPSRRISGFRGRPHYLQAAAFEALGIWLSPDERRFGKKDKEQFIKVLCAALAAVDGPVKSGMHHVLVASVINALGNSDEEGVADALRKFADHSDTYENIKGGELSRYALKAAGEVDRRGKRSGS